MLPKKLVAGLIYPVIIFISIYDMRALPRAAEGLFPMHHHTSSLASYRPAFFRIGGSLNWMTVQGSVQMSFLVGNSKAESRTHSRCGAVAFDSDAVYRAGSNIERPTFPTSIQIYFTVFSIPLSLLWISAPNQPWTQVADLLDRNMSLNHYQVRR